MGFKYSINNIKKHKLLSIIIITQIILGLFSSYFMINATNIVTKEIKKLDTTLNSGNIFSIRANWDYYEFLKDYNSEKILNDILEIDEVNIISMLSLGFTLEGFSHSDFNDIEVFSPFDNHIYIDGVAVNKAAVDNFNLELLSGRFFTDEEYLATDSTVLPIVLGYDFKGNFAIGDLIPLNYNGLTHLEVIGFLKEGSELPKYIGKPLDYKHKIMNIDNQILTTKRYWDKDSVHDFSLTDSYLYINSNNLNETKDKIKSIFLNEGVEVNISSEKVGIEVTLGDLIEKQELFSITSTLIIIFTAFTIIFTFMNSINIRKQEFGTYLLCGAKKKDLSKIIFYELALINVVAFLVFLILAFLVFDTISLSILSSLILFCIIYILLLSIVPLLKLKKLTIRDLTKGDE